MRFILYQNAAHWCDSVTSIQNIEDGLFSLKGSWREGDILVLPEMFSTGFITDESQWSDRIQLIENQEYTLSWMQRFAQENRIIVIGSMPYWNGENLFNRLYVVEETMKENKKDFEHYNKRHLFGIAGENRMYTPGNERKIITKEDLRLNLSICYDLRFPVWLRNRGEYDVLVCVANWPVARSTAWRSLLIARAIENQCFVVGVNRVGLDGTKTLYGGGSLAVGPDGVILGEMDDTETYCLFEPDVSFLHTFRRAYPFLKDADDFSLI
ncbi:MAG: nitrilase family protein [Cytophagia bacterium]|nr:nitrilase family protein [Cytophagia bacterium]